MIEHDDLPRGKGDPDFYGYPTDEIKPKKKGDKHEHKYIDKTETVTLQEGKARDTLNMWVCQCGSKITYDLKREIK